MPGSKNQQASGEFADGFKNLNLGAASNFSAPKSNVFNVASSGKIDSSEVTQLKAELAHFKLENQRVVEENERLKNKNRKLKGNVDRLELFYDTITGACQDLTTQRIDNQDDDDDSNR